MYSLCLFTRVKGGRQNRRVQPAVRVVRCVSRVQVGGGQCRIQIRGCGRVDTVDHAVFIEHATHWPSGLQPRREQNTRGLHHCRRRRALAQDVQTRLEDVGRALVA